MEHTAKLEGARVFGGKQVVILAPVNAPNKGDAEAAERDRLSCDCVLYVGDDDNDEDASALPGNIVSVRVGRKPQTHARYYVRSQNEVDDLLETLVQLRKSGLPRSNPGFTRNEAPEPTEARGS